MKRQNLVSLLLESGFRYKSYDGQSGQFLTKAMGGLIVEWCPDDTLQIVYPDGDFDQYAIEGVTPELLTKYGIIQ